LLVLVTLAGSGCDADPSDARPGTPATVADTRPIERASATPTVAPALPVTIVAVGDMMLGRSIGERILSEGASVVFDAAIAGTLGRADLTLGNLECAISERGEPEPKGYTFRAPPSAVEVLALGGFDVVSLANNHARDFGAEALADTAGNVGQEGIAAVGAGRSLEAASGAAIFERGGLRIAVVGLVDVPGEGAGFSRRTWEAGPDSWGVAWADVETVTTAVAAAAGEADVVIAMLHFGNEYEATPSASQRALARAAIDAGARLVVGSHPHVVQEVEEYGGGLIAYSLGNFVFDGFEGAANESAILRVTLGMDGIEGWELVPVEIVDNGLPRLSTP
jgi:poly-gamma-glutamate synthesis protein (capsule biosynthesis protein)